MKILSIETSCDETAISILEAEGAIGDARFSVLGNALYSQIDIHKEFGGVFPALAKREHGKNLIPILRAALTEAELLHANNELLTDEQGARLATLLEREGNLLTHTRELLEEIEKPDIHAIAVTYGPGLAPALWVGVNFAKALSDIWNIPLIPVNHMEGHILASLFDGEKIAPITFPALALLISGGHTELVLMKDWLTYELVGETQDDAVGEAFDKVARMMNLPYPGGPEISKLAEHARKKGTPTLITLPRPMLTSGDCHFSFSGLKTAVLYALKKVELTDTVKEQFAQEFEDAVAEILLVKTQKAIKESGAATVILGGGVAANTKIRRLFIEELTDTSVYLPEISLTGDNAVMIGFAGYFQFLKKGAAEDRGAIVADGNARLHA